MARPAGQVLDETAAAKPDDLPRRVWRQAAEQVRAELEETLKARVSTAYPPASEPGEYPHARTYEFHDGLRVVYSEEEKALRLYSHTHDRHGVFLQNGLRDGTTRPYATKIMQERDWNARINQVAIKMYQEATKR